MKKLLVLLLVGLVTASPTTGQTEKKSVDTLESVQVPVKPTEIKDSDLNEEVFLKATNIKEIDTPNENTNLEIIIEEKIDSPQETQSWETVNDADNEIVIDDSDNTVSNFNLYRNDRVSNAPVPNEIMETAEGFVPIPIFRNRQRNRKRFASRRFFRANPFRRLQFFYPYYGLYYPRYGSYFRRFF